MLRLRVVPKLKQWQGFSFLCLLAVLIFVVVAMAIRSDRERRMQGELDPDLHFQTDSTAGLFCENDNVRDETVSFFDYIDINLGDCPEHPDFGSRAYRIEYPPEGPREVHPQARRNYRQCFVSDFVERAPLVVEAAEDFFERNKDEIPCEHSIFASRIMYVVYNNIRNETKRIAFVHRYNIGDEGKFDIFPATAVAGSDQMQSVTMEPGFGFADSELMQVVADFGYLGVPFTKQD
jgi:hypothetical protein